MENKKTPKKNTYYNTYRFQKVENEAELNSLKAQRKDIEAPFLAKQAKLQKEGGEQTRKINDEIAELTMHIKSIKKEYDNKIKENQLEFYNTTAFYNQSTSKIKEKQTKRKIGKKIAGIGAIATGSAIAAKIANIWQIDQNKTDSFYLEHSEYAKDYVNKVVEAIERTKNAPPSAADEVISDFDTTGITPSNFLQRIYDGLITSVESLQNNPEKMNEVTDYLTKNNMLEKGQDTMSFMYAFINRTMSNVETQLFAENDGSLAASLTPDYTAAAAGAGAVLSAVILLGPTVARMIKLRSWNKKYAADKSKMQEDEYWLLKKRDGIIQDAKNGIAKLEEKKKVVQKTEFECGAAEIEKEKNKACELVDLKIERIETVLDRDYYEYLRKTALDGFDIAFSKETDAKTVKVGKPERYEEKIQNANTKIDLLDRQIKMKTSNKPTKENVA